MFATPSKDKNHSSGTYIQPQLEVGSPDDEYEKEANDVADKVMRMPESDQMPKMSAGNESVQMMRMDEEPIKMAHHNEGKIQMMVDYPKIQMKCDKCEEEEKKELRSGTPNIQMKCKKCDEEEEKIQKKSDTINNPQGNFASQEVTSQIHNSKGNGQPLPKSVQTDLGNKMNANLDNVKVHTDDQAAQLNKSLGAKAFTHGDDIYFNSGQYNPHSNEGKYLLTHELTHTQQQRGNKVNQKIQKKNGTEDRSVLKLKTPWTGVITAEDVGFHKEPGLGNNIYPSLKKGDKVTVLSVGENNWLHISRVENGKTETGYVDWRYVKKEVNDEKKKDLNKNGSSIDIESLNTQLKEYKLAEAVHSLGKNLQKNSSEFSWTDLINPVTGLEKIVSNTNSAATALISDFKYAQDRINRIRRLAGSPGFDKKFTISEENAHKLNSLLQPLSALSLSSLLAIPGVNITSSFAGLANIDVIALTAPPAPAWPVIAEILTIIGAVILEILAIPFIIVIAIIVAVALIIYLIVTYIDEIIEFISWLVREVAEAAVCAIKRDLCIARNSQLPRGERMDCLSCWWRCQNEGFWPVDEWCNR